MICERQDFHRALTAIDAYVEQAAPLGVLKHIVREWRLALDVLQAATGLGNSFKKPREGGVIGHRATI